MLSRIPSSPPLSITNPSSSSTNKHKSKYWKTKTLIMESRGMKSRFKVNEWDREFQTKSIQESRRVIKETNVKKKRQSRSEWKWRSRNYKTQRNNEKPKSGTKKTIHNEGERKGSLSINPSTSMFAFKDKLPLSHCYSRQQSYFLLFADL